MANYKRNMIQIIFSYMHIKNFYYFNFFFFIYVSKSYLFQDVSHDDESQHWYRALFTDWSI